MSATDSNKTILVTGASTGIGRASTLALLSAGFRVVAGVRNQPAADALRSTLQGAATDRLVTIELDVTDPRQIAAAVVTVGRLVGENGLWGLFNNAGIAVGGPLECVPIADLRRQLEVNVVGQLAVTQAFLPLLRRAHGRILTTGSMAGYSTIPGLGPYSMSKHAVEAMSDALRRELRPWGIEVSLLEPGSIATEIWDKASSSQDQIVKDPPPGLVELYGGLLKALGVLTAKAARDASPVEVVTRDVVHVFSAGRPRTRYSKGEGTGARKFLKHLPDRWMDAAIARMFRWG